ncbi:MAG: polysaccharide pyruvyl transferase family protein [Planctomycetota bacterium]
MKSPKILLIGIGGVYNYGCEAIVRGTERMLHERWPDARIVYASCRPKEDRARLKGCNVEIIRRKHIRRYSLRNIVRKLLSMSGISWYPTTDPPDFANGYGAVLSIGGDIYTIKSDGAGNRGFLRFGDACETRGVPYVLWGASVGPFSQNSETKRIFTKHLKNISLITARETVTVDYLQTLGIIDNVIPCADPAYVVASEIRTNDTNRRNEFTIGVNLSPLSVQHISHSLEESIYRQARTIEGLIKALNARIVLISHVVCDFMEEDDDLRYLHRLKQAIASEYQEDVTLLNNAIGFVGTKKELIKCNLVIAARMHCAINALAARVPTLLVSYSRKAEGMCRYVYGNGDWVVPLREFSTEGVLEEKVRSMKNHETAIRDYLDKRIPEIQQDAYRPMQRLREVLEDGEPPRKCGFPN